MSVLDRSELEQSPLADLHTIASELGLEGFRRLRKEELVAAIVSAQGGEPAPDRAPSADAAADEEALGEDLPAVDEDDAAPPEAEEEEAAGEEEPVEEQEEPVEEEPDEEPRSRREEPAEEVRAGTLDILPNGSGFMRDDPFAHARDDVYVSPAQIRRCELRTGDRISGPVRPPRRSERHPSLVRVEEVNDAPSEPPAERPRFADLEPRFATERLSSPEGLEAVPYGKGSRVAVSGQPGAGATTFLRNVATLLRERHPEVELTVVLAGVRPEEVAEWREGLPGAVAGGGADRPVDEQAQAAEMAVHRAKRAVESGRDSALVIDSLDALTPATARRAFAAARNAEGGGTLTVFAAVGMAQDALRIATTRIFLQPTGPGEPPALAPGSGTTRGDLLG